MYKITMQTLHVLNELYRVIHNHLDSLLFNNNCITIYVFHCRGRCQLLSGEMGYTSLLATNTGWHHSKSKLSQKLLRLRFKTVGLQGVLAKWNLVHSSSISKGLVKLHDLCRQGRLGGKTNNPVYKRCMQNTNYKPCNFLITYFSTHVNKHESLVLFLHVKYRIPSILGHTTYNYIN